MTVQLEHEDTIRQSLQFVAYSVSCIGNATNTVVWTTHRTPDPKTCYMRRKNQKHRCFGHKIDLYNFILYLILHCTQKYIPSVF